MKRNLCLYALSIIALLCSATVSNAQQVECWDRFEVTLTHAAKGNPFDVELSATFVCGNDKKTVAGFYDGDNTYKIRFMPTKEGKWSYTTSSNAAALNRKRGEFTAITSSGDNHGMVVTDGLHDFKYADGTRYYPFGTTAYAWTHMAPETQEQTLKTLAASGFNKVRMCVFPKNYNLVKEEPTLYPFEVKSTVPNAEWGEKKVWDFEKFDPAFFRHLEKRIDQLAEMGIESDLILFHPYDKGRWGFDEMTNEVNVRYIKYITARLSSFRNVWWSMANEWDYVKAKTVDDWDMLTREVVAADPYRHLCSIHGATATYYDYWNPEFTHVSIQDEAPVLSMTSAAMLRNIYRKPVVCDEVGYEGNLASRWGRWSPQQMTWLTLNGLMGGVYVTHGECYNFGDNPIFWAQGGEFHGESWKRVKFLRDIVEASPNPWQPADVSRDYVTATAGDGYYFVSLGKDARETWKFNLPIKNSDVYPSLRKERRFRVEIINLWDMTIVEYPVVFETMDGIDYRVYDKNVRDVRLPDAPYLLLRITDIDLYKR